MYEGESYSRRKTIIYKNDYDGHIAYKTEKQGTSRIKRVIKDSENKGAY
jgi:pyruvate/2-oxoglutarate dehydrogenase complex dihydrolipoamide acyltransferase (E2) component